MFDRSCSVLAVALLVCPACGGEELDPPPIATLEIAVPAALGVFGTNPNFVVRMPVEAAFVAYRGDGDVWQELSGQDGAYEFEIEHPRYTLWVQCPRWFETQGAIRVLHLGAEDTDRPAVECPVAEPDRALSWLEVAIGDTPNSGGQGFGVAMGGAEVPPHSVLGAIISARFYGPAEGVDLDRLSILAELFGGARALRAERGVRIAGQYTVDADFTGHAPCVDAAIPEVGDWSTVTTRYISGQHTGIKLRGSVVPLGGIDTATVTLAPEAMRDADDVHLVSSRDRWTQHLSFRADPRAASFSPAARVAQPDLTGLDERGLQFEVPDLRGQAVRLSVTASSSAPLTVLASATWLDGAQTIPTPVPPTFDPTWRLGDPGDVFELTAEVFDGNRTVRELVEDYLFDPRAAPPRRWDGFDITMSAHLRRGLLE